MSSQQESSWVRAIFLLGVSLLFTHELDAMTHTEWRVLPLTSWLSPELGRLVFVAMHVPAFAFVLGWLTSQVAGRASRAQFWVAVFLVAHAALHLAFSGHADVRVALVVGGGVEICRRLANTAAALVIGWVCEYGFVCRHL